MRLIRSRVQRLEEAATGLPADLARLAAAGVPLAAWSNDSLDRLVAALSATLPGEARRLNAMTDEELAAEIERLRQSA